MLRIPPLRYRAPRTAREAAEILAGEGPGAVPVGGGTDLFPRLKRGQQGARVLVGLARVEGLSGVRHEAGETVFGAGVRLSALVADPRVRERFTALHHAAAQVASPAIRNRATLGGNLCLETRCTWIDQGEGFRGGVGPCLKCEGGDVCHVAPGSSRCLAVSSTDCAPALAALGARVRLVCRDGDREVPVAGLYRDDGIEHLVRRWDEILVEVRVPVLPGTRSAYWKARRRGSIDFPLLGVAASARLDGAGAVAEARICLGASASRPFLVAAAASALVGRAFDDAAIEEAARQVSRAAAPVDNTDLTPSWRKQATRAFARLALRDLRGDDLAAERRRFAPEITSLR